MAGLTVAGTAELHRSGSRADDWRWWYTACFTAEGYNQDNQEKQDNQEEHQVKSSSYEDLYQETSDNQENYKQDNQEKSDYNHKDNNNRTDRYKPEIHQKI